MRLSVTVLFCGFITAAFTAHARTWELRNGTRIVGKFVRLEGNDVRLRVGRDANLYPFSRFSVRDQEFIRFFHGLLKHERDAAREEIDKHPERVWTLKNGQQGKGRFLRFFRAELPNGAVVPYVTILPIQSFPYAALLQKDQAYVRHVLEEMGIEKEELWWYLETRKFGTCIHSGFGLGFERLVMFVSGMKNIRDVIPFPRTPQNAEF